MTFSNIFRTSSCYGVVGGGPAGRRAPEVWAVARVARARKKLVGHITLSHEQRCTPRAAAAAWYTHTPITSAHTHSALESAAHIYAQDNHARRTAVRSQSEARQPQAAGSSATPYGEGGHLSPVEIGGPDGEGRHGDEEGGGEAQAGRRREVLGQ